MGSLSIWHWLVVLAIILVLFGGGKGAGRISSMMGDLGKGFRSFKQNLAEDDTNKPKDASMASTGSLNAPMAEPVKTSTTNNV